MGLGYTALREDRVATADSMFRIVVGRDPGNGDGWDGLAHAAYRLGDKATAIDAAHHALRLIPGNTAVRALLSRLDPDWDRAPIPT
ncbi:MAG: tetratricopeptide repeat protein, partial [Gemmatimonadales bacterium]